MRKIVILMLALVSAPLFGQNWYQQRIAQLESENRELRKRIEALEAQVNPDGVSSLDGLYFGWDNLTGIEEDVLSCDDGLVGGIEEPAAADPFMERLSKVNALLQVPYDETVRSYIDVYSKRRYRSLIGAFRRYEQQKAYFTQVFSQHGIPEQMTLLCVLESACSPGAVSKAGAAGMWQLMPSTATGHGLVVDEIFGDDRFNVQKSTPVAAQVLKGAYGRLGDWKLVLLAYNCGEGRLRKAIVQAGTTDFWELLKYLPEETQRYVPHFLAICYVYEYQDILG